MAAKVLLSRLAVIFFFCLYSRLFSSHGFSNSASSIRDCRRQCPSTWLLHYLLHCLHPGMPCNAHHHCLKRKCCCWGLNAAGRALECLSML